MQKPSATKNPFIRIPRIPLPLVMILLSILTALVTNMGDAAFIAAFSKGFGRSLGYFAILLLSSFFIAAAIGKGGTASLGRLSAFVSPFTGAAMVCPDTSYATLSPMAGNYRSHVSVGSYAGFKLLVPAGPLIVGVALAADVGSPRFIFLGLALTISTVIAGLLWLSFVNRSSGPRPAVSSPAEAKFVRTLRLQTTKRLLPLLCLAALLVAGFMLNSSANTVLRFFTSPVGALVGTSVLTYAMISPEIRRECLESAMRRSASLLLVIGSAMALGEILTETLSLEDIATYFQGQHSSLVLIIFLFAVTSLFKVLNGSSMATFAAVPPLLSPVIANSSISLETAVYAICLGSFVAALPNDSYFWLTQPNDGAVSGEGRPDFTFAGVSIIQGLVGLLCLCAYVMITGNG